MTLIKPHHFMDILKLHGAGLDQFVPDTKYGHDFYKVGNAVLSNLELEMQFTIHGDDICTPCIHRDAQRICQDAVTNLPGYTSKDAYNKLLDTRIIEILHLDTQRVYTAKDACALFYANKELVFKVWDLEAPELCQKRYTLFCAGCEKYLSQNLLQSAGQPVS